MKTLNQMTVDIIKTLCDKRTRKEAERIMREHGQVVRAEVKNAHYCHEILSVVEVAFSDNMEFHFNCK